MKKPGSPSRANSSGKSDSYKKSASRPSSGGGKFTRKATGEGEESRGAGRPKRDDDRPPFDKTRKFSPSQLSEESKTSRRSEGGEEKKPFRRKSDGDDRKPAFRKREVGSADRKPFRRSEEGGERKPFKRRDDAGGGERKPFRRDESGGDRKPAFRKREEGDEKRPFRSREGGDGERKPYARKSEGGEKRPYQKREDGERRPYKPREEGEGAAKRPYAKREDGERKPYKRREEGEGERKPYAKRDGASGERKPYAKREGADGEKKPFRKREDGDGKRPFVKRDGPRKPLGRKKDEDEIEREQFEDKVVKELETTAPMRRFKKNEEEKAIEAAMTLNKYIAHSGECGRREAAAFVKQGKVRVNGEMILEPGYRVQPGDEVSLLGKKLTPQRNNVYVLLNKPKGFITTTDDPQERKTVMDLVSEASEERLYPVGRLDRNTTGLLLMTNDGTLAHKLSHPSYRIKKVYHVTLDKNLAKTDYQQIAKGIELEDGLVQVDEIAYLEERNEIGLEIHSGKNRVVRRIFESLGYVVEKLDRMMYAGLTKKNLPRGKWRLLDDKEIIMLKHFKS